MNEYFPLIILMALAGLVSAAIVSLSALFGPKHATPYKESPYECGVTPLGNAVEKFPIKFYLVAMLFILFDIEVIFLWPWLSIFKSASLEFQLYSFCGVMLYMALWIIGDIYVLKMNAIDWDEDTALEEAKSGILASVDPSP